MAQAADVQSTAQTNTSLQAAPGSGNQLVVSAVYISSDTAQTVSLESAGTVRWRQYVAANGGQTMSAPSGKHLFTCADNAALTYSTSATGNVFVSVQYDIEKTNDQTS